jgi:hypothetical protein
LDFPWINRNKVQPKVLTILHLINALQISFHDCYLLKFSFQSSFSYLMIDVRSLSRWPRFFLMSFFFFIFFEIFFQNSILFTTKLFFFSILPYIRLLCLLRSFSGFWQPQFVLQVLCFLIIFFHWFFFLISFFYIFILGDWRSLFSLALFLWYRAMNLFFSLKSNNSTWTSQSSGFP